MTTRPMNRRDALACFATAAGGFALTRVASALPTNGVFSKDSAAMIDRLISPASSLMLHDPGGDYYQIRSFGLPSHATGTFPTSGCPGAILPQFHSFMIAKQPQVAAAITPLNMWLFGVASNGVVFDPSGPSWKYDAKTGWTFEVASPNIKKWMGIDDNFAHTQPTGEYHYHAMPTGLITQLEADRSRRGEAARMLFLGWAADGFPIYGPMATANANDLNGSLVEMRSSYKLLSGSRPANSPKGAYNGDFVQDYQYVAGSGHLDECNGRFGKTPEFPNGTYYYVITNMYPFIPRYWRGTPHASFTHGSPDGNAKGPDILLTLYP